MAKLPPFDFIGLVDLAAQLRTPLRRVQRVVQRLGVGRKVSRTWILTRAEALLVAAEPVREAGNPNFVPGNHFGKPAPKKPAVKKPRKR